MTDRPSYFRDVGDFHRKFDLPAVPGERPAPLTHDLFRYRAGFLAEEFAEFVDACGYPQIAMTLKSFSKAVRTTDQAPLDVPSLEEAADALADLVYVALGTAHLMGLPFEEVWDEVQRANMTKVRATGADDARSKRSHAADVVKPEGFRPPDHGPAIAAAKGERP